MAEIRSSMLEVLPHWVRIDRDGNITIKGKIVLDSDNIEDENFI